MGVEHNNRYKKKYPWMQIYQSARARCTKKYNGSYKSYGAKGIKFLLTKEGIKFLWFRDKAYLLSSPSIDRIDSKGHYQLSNCKFIERRLNQMRHGRAKFDFDKADRIRILNKKGFSYRELAKEFNCSNSAIGAVCRNNSWRRP